MKFLTALLIILTFAAAFGVPALLNADYPVAGPDYAAYYASLGESVVIGFIGGVLGSLLMTAALSSSR